MTGTSNRRRPSSRRSHDVTPSRSERPPSGSPSSSSQRSMSAGRTCAPWSASGMRGSLAGTADPSRDEAPATETPAIGSVARTSAGLAGEPIGRVCDSPFAGFGHTALDHGWAGDRAHSYRASSLRRFASIRGPCPAIESPTRALRGTVRRPPRPLPATALLGLVRDGLLRAARLPAARLDRRAVLDDPRPEVGRPDIARDLDVPADPRPARDDRPLPDDVMPVFRRPGS